MAKRSMTPEGKLKKAVNALLRDSGAFYMRMNSGIVRVKGGFLHLHEEGTADFLVFQGMLPAWIELKAPGQTTKKSRIVKQAEFAAKVKKWGHKHIQAESLEQVIQFLS